MKLKPGGKTASYGVAEWQNTNTRKDKSKAAAEAQLHCDGSVWIL